ncbi:MAG: molecular chaperone DnaJ [Clostridiales bacterium]|nr:molecular chaperone DnaJ [Clostridiales bacterium]
MAEKRDYYEVMGVDKSASQDQIKKAYRKKAKECHPDFHPDDPTAEAKFKELNEANEVLSDPDKRAAYDRYGHAAFDQTGGMGGGGFSGGGFSGSMNMDDIFGDLGGIFGSMFGGGGSRQRRNGPVRGTDIAITLVISFEEAVFGCVKKADVNTIGSCGHCHGTGAKPGTSPQTCPTCHGTGMETTMRQTVFGMAQSTTTCHTCGGKGTIIKEPCPGCNGTGKVRKQNQVDVNIPAGINNGQTIRKGGLGNAGTNGGENGDLLISVSVQPSPRFIRQENNILSDVKISVVQALLGDEITIPTIDGEEKYNIKPGTQPDTKIFLKGKGVPFLRNKGRRGDHIVTVKIEIPTNISDRQKELIREFAGLPKKEKFSDKVKKAFS